MTYFDAHCHALFAGRELQGAILSECKDASELVSKIRHFLTENQQLTWLDLSAVKAGFPIDRYILDQASTELPIVVHTDDHHSICVNSKALEIAGYSNSAPEVAGGRFDSQNGKPNGWIHEYVAMQLIYQHQPKPTLEQDLAALLLAQEILLGHDIAKQTEAWIDPGMPDVYFAAVEQNLLKIETDLAIRITPENAEAELLFASETKAKAEKIGSPLLTCNTVKLFIDGVHSSNTAWLKAHPESAGVWEPNHLLETAEKAVRAGFGLHFHACGDAAVKQALEVVQRVSPSQAVIAHADLIDPADLAAIAAAGIIINSTPVWAETAPDDHFNFRAIIDAGIPLCFGSDWPVSRPDMRAQIAAAVKYRGLTVQEAEAAARFGFEKS